MSDYDLDFETKTCYFFGIKDFQPIADLYFNVFKQTGEEMLATLHKVYLKIQTYTPWKFDALKAAKLEQEIIHAFDAFASFESIVDLYRQIYACIFNQDKEEFDKIAQLRAFLFYYKDNIDRTGKLTDEDKALLVSIARLSEYYLKEFETKAVQT